jgi:hypothetical protein
MRIFGWLLFALTCALVVAQGFFLGASNYSLTAAEVFVDHVFPLLGIGAMVGAGVGALIVSRYPHNLIGWLLLVGQLGNMIGLSAISFRVLVVQGIVEAPLAGQLAGYLGDVFGTVFAVVVMSLIFMIAPDGRLLSKRWRLAVAVAISTQLAWWAGVAAQPPEVYLPGAPTPLGLRETFTAQVLTLIGFFGMLLSISLGAIALVLRLRRSTGQERLQLRWIATGAAGLAVTFTLFALSDLLPNLLTAGFPSWILPEATALAYIFFSVSVGVAIFRYRLYDIDLILSRAIVLGVLAIFVTVGYVAVVVAIGAALTAIDAAGSTLYWPSLVATALVAVAFQPIRAHVLRLADQLVYGSRAAPYEALAELSRRLANSPSPDALPARVAEATGRAVGAAATRVWLGEPGGSEQLLSANWSAAGAGPGQPIATGQPAPTLPPSAPSLTLPVLDAGKQVGGIEVTMPTGRSLRTFERDLLADVAAQAGVAFRNAVLENELAARVTQGKAQSAELTASRRRLVSVEDDARERLAGAIRRQVVPHLAAVDQRLSHDAERPPAAIGLSHSAAPAVDTPQVLPAREADQQNVEPLIAETELALDELRTVCRGVFPALLERRGLIPALSAQLDETHPAAVLKVDDSARRRLNRAAEAAGYLFCVEVTPLNRPSVIEVRVAEELLIITVSGDRTWALDCGAPATLPAAWQHASDRVSALEGTIWMRPHSTGLLVTAEIPLAAQPDRVRVMADQVASSRSGPNIDLGT